jgi:hypothetical protein
MALSYTTMIVLMIIDIIIKVMKNYNIVNCFIIIISLINNGGYSKFDMIEVVVMIVKTIITCLRR